MVNQLNFIISASANFFDINPEDDWRNDQKLSNFLNNSNCLVLLVRRQSDGIEFETEILEIDRDGLCLAFYKQFSSNNDEEDNERISLGITSLHGSAGVSLYHALNAVYTPLLQKDEWCSSVIELVNGLQAGLKANVIVSGDTAVYLTVQDEVEYWSAIANKGKNASERDKAKSIVNILQPMARSVSTLDTVSIIDAEDILDGIQNSLDDLWRLSIRYPQVRMERLLETMGHAFVNNCQSRLAIVPLWDKEGPGESVESALQLCERWLECCQTLTKLFWANYSVHAWVGPPHDAKYCSNFIKRLKEIQTVREVYANICRWLPFSDQLELKIEGILKHFRDVPALQIDAYTETQWRQCMKTFELSLIPTDDRLSAIIKSRLLSVKDNTAQMLHVLSSCSSIVRRRGVQNALKPEREMLCSSLQGLVDTLGSQVANPPAITNVNFEVPVMLQTLHWCGRIEKQVLEIQKVNDTLMQDLAGNRPLRNAADDLLKEVQRVKKDTYDTWCEDTLQEIESNEVKVDDTAPVVEFDGGSWMRVTYSPRLEVLSRETRGLVALGYSVPAPIRTVVEAASKHAANARALQQIANFHNTIGERMVPSQRPMMLAGALELSRLVERQSAVPWGDPGVANYLAELRAVAQKLSADNNFLAEHHTKIREKVMELMEADLLKQQSLWRDNVKFIRDTMSKIEDRGFKNLRTWRLHWDHQLYKALEAQYQRGIEDLNQYLADITIDLVFRQQQLQFIPRMEEIRMRYFTQLKKFLSIPLTFRGVSEYADPSETTVFTVMVERNSDRFGPLFSRAEVVFEKLEQFKNLWKPWVALGCIDIDALCEIHLSAWQDWDREFRSCKAFSQQVAKLTSSEEKVECFRINLSLLRTNIESQSRLYWDALSTSLRASILEEVTILETFIKESMQILQQPATTSRDIRESSARHEKILSSNAQMGKLLDSIQHKNTTLASWCKERVDTISQLASSWERFQGILKNHRDVLEKQVDEIKVVVTSQLDNLKEEMEKFWIRWQQAASPDVEDESLDSLDRSMNSLKDKSLHWDELMGQKKQLLMDCETFNIEPPDLSFCDEVEIDMGKQTKMYELFGDFKKELSDISGEEWIVFRKRAYRLEDFLTSWQKKLTDVDMNPIIHRIHKEIDNYHSMLPALQYLHGDSFTSLHWSQVLSLIGAPYKNLEALTLGDFLSVAGNILASISDLQNIAKQAASEQVVRGALNELEQWGLTAKLSLGHHIDTKGNSIEVIKDYQDVLSKIGDNQCLLQSIKNSTNYESFSDQAQIWERRLDDLDQYLTNLNLIQRKWVYLEPVFGAGTLRTEEGRFLRLDRDFRYIMEHTSRDPRVVTLCRVPNVQALLANLMEQLTLCQNSLNDFLASKRSTFPRFFFLGDEELLEVVGREDALQRHLRKLFAGVHSVTMKGSGKETGRRITELHSAEGEIVVLDHPVEMSGPVEVWLGALVAEMRSTLRSALIRCVQLSGSENRALDFPAQLLCLAECISFTARCEKAINDMSLAPLLENLKAQLNHYTSSALDISSTAQKDDSNDSKILGLKLKALLVEHIHHISVIQELIQYNVSSTQDWHWTSQLRFYLNNQGSAIIRMVNAEFQYSYEYLGNITRLVHTSLTHKCYLTLTQAMHLGLGGNPVGPAGTGKTECVKSMGSMLGRHVLVFNCDEGIDATAMGRILTGLALCGSWGCFDEFNRLQEATLSAVSMLLQPLQAAIKNREPQLEFQGEKIALDSNCGVFVTLNPSGVGYGGRNRLPANLQALFRPVIMASPRPRDIARVLLFAEGFRCADIIADRIVELFDLSSKLLSPQQHYDWGLRALKTILSWCGKILADTRQQLRNEMAEDREMEIAVQGLRVNTISKLTHSDSIKFNTLIKDVFPGVAFKSVDHAYLEEALQKAFVELNLQPNEAQVSKCFDLYEQLQQRMGVVLVGPAGSGKSTVMNLLKHALALISRKVKSHTLSPKALPRKMLLGHTDSDTRQWTDGVLTRTAQIAHDESEDSWSWVVCDGDIDPEWIESLNSVLDDNRLLTLPSGWRIQFGENINFLFETHELTHASPATVSRMAIIHFSEKDLNVQLLATSWLQTQNEINRQLLSGYLQNYLSKGLDWIFKNEHKSSSPSSASLVKSALARLRGISNKQEFAIHFVNGLGGFLRPESREDFSKEVFEWIGEYLPDQSKPLLCYFNPIKSTMDIYATKLPSMNFDPARHGLPLVQTPDVQVASASLGRLLEKDRTDAVLLVAPSGCGERLILESIVSQQDQTKLVVVHCNGHLGAQHVLAILEQHCLVVTGSRGKEYRARSSKLYLFFKDLNLAHCDRRGTSMVVQLLIQIITYGGFYDNKLDWVSLLNVQIIASITDQLITVLSPRFLSVVNIYTLSYPTKEDLKTIYSFYLSTIINTLLPKHAHLGKLKEVDKLTSTMLTIYEELKSLFSSSKYTHYAFTPRDLTQWCQNLLLYKADNKEQEEPAWLLQIIVRESYHIFRDRLSSMVDKSAFNSVLEKVMHGHWGNAGLQNLGFYVCMETQSFKSLSWVNDDDWIAMVEQGINHFSRDNVLLDLVVNKELLYAVSSISRTLGQSGGHIVLLNTNGCGRKAALRIASALRNAKLTCPIIGRSYGLKELFADFKSAMQTAALDNTPVWFLLEQHALDSIPGIMGPLGSLLSSGEIPRLFGEELQSLATPLRDYLSGLPDEPSTPVELFMQRVKNNLHLAICLDSSGAELNTLFSVNPMLYRNCCVKNLTEWSDETLKEMPRKIIEMSKEDHIDGVGTDIPAGFIDLHLVTGQLATAKRFLTFIKTYHKFVREKTKNLLQNQKKLEAGVQKLTEARSVVGALEADAAVQDASLTEKRQQAAKALDMIQATMRSATTHRGEMLKLREETEKENALLVERKKEIEVELQEVEPLLQAARSAVGDIKGEALAEIRSLRAPPEVIRDILEGVLRLMGTLDTSWNSMKSFLAKRGVKEDIKLFDASRITVESRKAVEHLMTTKPTSFTAKAAQRASAAAAPLANWVTANVKYAQVLEKIRPLEKEQRELLQNLHLAEEQISELSTGLSSVDDRVASLTGQLNQYTQEAAQIELRLQAAQSTLKSAQDLVGKLHDEYLHWQTQLTAQSEDLKILPTRATLAAACVTYLPSETEESRKAIWDKWLSILRTDDLSNFSLVKFLSSEQELLQWNSKSLPSDKLSIENAIFIVQSINTPLIVDPSGSALPWLLQYVKSESKCTDIATQSSPKLAHSLELAARFGKTLLITEVDRVDGVVLPILRSETLLQGNRTLVQAGNHVVDLHGDFKLILISRNYKHQFGDLVTMVNFSTTRDGLAAKLVQRALLELKPELEARQKALWIREEDLQSQRTALNDRLLQTLADAQGDILQNQELLDSLNAAKTSSAEIESSLAESHVVREEIESQSAIYNEPCRAASSAFFAAQELGYGDPLCRISVAAFERLFLKALTGNAKGDTLQLEEFKKKIVQLTYHYLARGMFKSEHLLVALHLGRRLFEDEIPQIEWDVFTKRSAMSVGNEDIESSSSPIPHWLNKEQSQNIHIIKTCLPDLYNALSLINESAWRATLSNSGPDTTLHVTVTLFQTVLVYQALKPDRLYTAMSNCAIRLLDLQSLSPTSTQLRQVLSESIPAEPILLIASPGTDPSKEVTELAGITIGQNYREISMGEGQEQIALRTVQTAATHGHWVCLKNVHLVTNWLTDLDEHIHSLQPHQDFRLWLTTERTGSFPVSLARNCLKLSYELPRGLRAAVTRTLTNWGPSGLQGFSPGSHQAPVFVGLAILHAALLERRAFIPQGWSKYYEFSESDLWTARQLISQCCLVGSGRPDWSTLRGLCSTLAYGGKIDGAEQDALVLDSYLHQFFNAELYTRRWKPLGIALQLPQNDALKEHLAAVNTLSEEDEPDQLGLPKNIKRVREVQGSAEIITKLTGLPSSEFHVSSKISGEWNRAVVPYLNLWKKLNQNSKLLQASAGDERFNIDKDDVAHPLEMFAMREYAFALNLVQRIHGQLSAISRVIRGISSTNKDVDSIAQSLVTNQIPEEWLNMWNGPYDSTIEYLKALTSKANQAYNIITQGEFNTLLDKPIDFSLLFHPETFLTVLKQLTSRKTGFPLDSLLLTCSWSNDAPNNIAYYAKITGIQIEGGVFSKFSKLQPCVEESPSFMVIPMCNIYWLPNSNLNNGSCLIPLYNSPNRTTMIAMLPVLVTSEPKDYWLNSGTALCISK